jgi:hypothetical protein
MFKVLSPRILLIFLFSLFILASCTAGEEGAPDLAGHPGGDGSLETSVISPFGEVLEESRVIFPAARASSTSAMTTAVSTNRYSEFPFGYETTSLSVPTNPFCKEGGQYTQSVSLDVFNTGGPVSTTDSFNLYYCKTTQDLMERMEIPLSWGPDELLLYCNDGSAINLADINPDIFTSQVNAYKVCVLKNLDLEEDNTILYGFDVGNTEVDSDPRNTFSQDTLSGQVVGTLENGELESSQTVTETRTVVVAVPFTTSCTPRFREIKDDILIPDGETCVQVPQTDDTVIESTIASAQADFTSFRKLSDNSLTKESLFEVTLTTDAQLTSQSFTTTSGDPFFFDFDERTTYFVLRSVEDELTLPLLSRFRPLPDDFGLSRIAFFRAFSSGDPRVALGYERPAKFEVSTESTAPIYTIEFQVVSSTAPNFFSRVECMETLGIFGALERNTLRLSDGIICKVDGSIKINSLAFDAEHGEGASFALFKNIITDLE